MKNYVKPSDLHGDSFQIVRFLKLHETNDLYVTVRFYLPRFGIDETLTIPMADVKSSKFRDYIPPAFALEGVRTANQPEWLRAEINDALVHATVETLLPPGFSYIMNRWTYVMGNLVLNGKDLQVHTHDPLNLQLSEADRQFPTLQPAFEWIKTFCEQGPAQCALLLCALTPFLRPVTEQLKLPARVANAYIWGQSGSGKSEFAKLVSSLSKTTAAHGVNLSCNQKTILEELSKYRDCAFLIDDMNLTDSSHEMEKKKCRISELIQRTHSAGKITNKDEAEIDFSRISLAVSAEYLLRNCSSLNRMIVIPMNEPFHPDALTYLQNNRRCFTQFVMIFTEYICKYAMQLSGEVRHLLGSSEFDIQVPHENVSMYSGFQRMACTHKLLQCTRHLFMAFWKDLGLSPESSSWLNLQACLKEGIDQAVSATLANIQNPCKQVPPILKEVLEIFAYDRNKIVAKSFKEYQKKSGYVIFRHANFFYCKADKLAGYLCGILQADISNKRLIAELKKAFLLTIYSDDFTAKLSPIVTGGKKAKCRYCRIHVDTIMDMLKEVYPNTLFLTSPIREFHPNIEV